MTLQSFDETNQVHLDKFKYFSTEAGHPQYIIGDDIEDMDIGFRESVQKIFKLGNFFMDECNGSFHQLIVRAQDYAELAACFYALDDEDENFELLIKYNGKLFFDTDQNEVLFKPEFHSILKISEEDFEKIK